MTAALVPVLTVAAALGCGVVGGIFFAFSSFVMAALGRLRPEQGIAAMQSVNLTVLNPGFFLVFFGSAAVTAGVGLVAAAGWADGRAGWLLAGSALYLFGCIAMTIVCNVPMNDELATLSPGAADAAARWRRYRRVWTAWNHVRTAASLAAAGAFTVALS